MVFLIYLALICYGSSKTRFVYGELISRSNYFRDVSKTISGHTENDEVQIDSSHCHQCGLDKRCSYLGKSVQDHTYKKILTTSDLPKNGGKDEIWEKMIKENIAYKRPSSQSSIQNHLQIDLISSFGNDGNMNGDWSVCSATKSDLQPWWQVDLNRQAAVSNVVIRSGSTWGQVKINPFYISIGDENVNGGRNNPLCVNEGTVASGEVKSFLCTPILYGRYVSVYINRREYLQVCEVEVYEG